MKILIATDGSDYGKAAVDEACRVVIDPKRDEVLVVSVYEDPYPLTAEPFALSPEYYEQLEESARNLAFANVEDAQKVILGKFPDSGLRIKTETLRGWPDQQIIERSKEWDADLIVVGSHGYGFWGRLLGSVSNGVVHHAECSVLVVRQKDQAD